jgi:Protein of unknown function (DUF3341)
MTNSKPQFGVLAEYKSTADIYHACEKVRDSGFKHWDAHTPFPVHGLEKAMGVPPSKLPWIVLVMALTGASLGMGLQWWINVIEYPQSISSKPFFSWQAFVPVTFEISVLLGAFGAVFGMFGLNQLPKFYHSVFKSKAFLRATDDRFFISIEARDPRFDPIKTPEMLKQSGALSVEWLEH